MKKTSVPSLKFFGLENSWFRIKINAKIAFLFTIIIQHLLVFIKFLILLFYRYVPPGIDCPSTVYGVGTSKLMALKAAKLYASSIGDDKCDKYVGHCITKKFIK